MTHKDGNKLEDSDSRSKNDILNGLNESVYTKVVHCQFTKEIWDKLKNNYEGDSKVKGEKVQNFRSKFEKLKIKEDKNIPSYFIQVDETVNVIKCLGEEINETIIV
jgi:hypothetical protein